MVDIKDIKVRIKYYEDNFAKRNYKTDLKKIVRLYDESLTLKKEIEQLQSNKNKGAKEFELAKKRGEKNLDELAVYLKKDNDIIQFKIVEYKMVTEEFNKMFLELPNVLDKEVVNGDKEHNEVIKVWGDISKWDKSKNLDHYDICEKLGLVDYKRAAKISGRGFTLYSGIGARLEWALLQYMIDMQLKFKRYFIYPPTVMKKECGVNAGQYPNKIGGAWGFGWDSMNEECSHTLIPTAETILVNMHIDEVLKESELPIKYFAYSNCYRKEQLAYGSRERGMIRGFEFHKVEMVTYCTPENNKKELAGLILNTEKIVQGLGLHYRLVKCASRDVAFAMAETVDCEVLIPSFGYTEVSSISSALDYQMRSTNTKYITTNGDKKYPYTLNASGIATSRIIPAICEQFQNEDGSVNVPKVLQKYLGGIKVLK